MHNWKTERELFESSYDLDIENDDFNELIFNDLFGKSNFNLENNISSPKPIAITKKTGRNEKVSVRYIDGTIKTGIKYKLIESDIDNGKCEII